MVVYNRKPGGEAFSGSLSEVEQPGDGEAPDQIQGALVIKHI